MISSSARNVGIAALLIGSIAIGAIAVAQNTTPEPKRAILERFDQSGVPGKEIVLGTAELPAGAVIGWHTHNGDEDGYVLRGDLVLKVRGQPDRTLKAGDFFFNPRGSVHSLMAAPGTAGGMALSSWIIDKGKPLAEPAK